MLNNYSGLYIGCFGKSQKRIFVLDGDGNILMNLNSLVTTASLKLKNIVHIILDNHMHESTGGQPTFSTKNEILDIGKSLGYKSFSVNSKKLGASHLIT